MQYNTSPKKKIKMTEPKNININCHFRRFIRWFLLNVDLASKKHVKIYAAFSFFLKWNKIKLFAMQSEMQNINILLQKFDFLQRVSPWTHLHFELLLCLIISKNSLGKHRKHPQYQSLTFFCPSVMVSASVHHF